NMMNKKGQGALEYLLLIGGAVLVAVIVITLLLQITSQGETDTRATADAAAILQCDARLNAICNEEIAAGTTTQAEIDTACAGNSSAIVCP
ncbi:class III signal peptide-containing protein, partial [archaeon]|nr:class III signal peptide-containing protein [archaeon]